MQIVVLKALNHLIQPFFVKFTKLLYALDFIMKQLAFLIRHCLPVLCVNFLHFQRLGMGPVQLSTKLGTKLSKVIVLFTRF